MKRQKCSGCEKRTDGLGVDGFPRCHSCSIKKLNRGTGNPKDQVAAQSNRVDMTLFPETAIAIGSLAFTEGDLKYSRYNWRKSPVRASVYCAAAKRHLAKWFNGQAVDGLTRVPHLASALACLAIIIDADSAGTLIDDRPDYLDDAEINTLFSDCEDVVGHLKEVFGKDDADGE